MSGYNSKKEMANSRWVVELIEDGEDLILPLPDEMIEGTGWKIGDDLIFEPLPGNAWLIRKKQ